MNRQRKPFELVHGMLCDPEYNAWRAMHARCYSPNHPAYDRQGRQGIGVCESWFRDFPAFYDDMGPRPSPNHWLTRKDPAGQYEPANCVWALRGKL